MESCIPLPMQRNPRGARRLVSFLAALALTLPLAWLSGCGNNGPPDFTLTLNSAAAATITPGGTAMVTFQVSAVKGSVGSITLVLSGLPTGVGVAPGSATVGIGSTQQFNLSAASATALSATPVTLTATGVSGNPLDSSSITHTATLTLSVVAPPQ